TRRHRSPPPAPVAGRRSRGRGPPPGSRWRSPRRDGPPRPGPSRSPRQIACESPAAPPPALARARLSAPSSSPLWPWLAPPISTDPLVHRSEGRRPNHVLDPHLLAVLEV